MALKISSRIRRKLEQKHGVSESEIRECFTSREGKFLEDTREENRTDPPTKWFIAETDRGRLLKIVFVPYQNGNNIDVVIKTAYAPNETEQRIYSKYGK